MEVEQVLHMNGGVGQTSYANNSSLQKVVISTARRTLEESITDQVYCNKVVFPECLKIADLGCSSGPNTLTAVSYILDIIEATCQSLNMNKSPAFQVFLNDLPGNDFNAIFRSFSSFYERLKKEKGDKFGPCFITAMPGSFYGRLFPDNSMHIVHSSYSLHWLSQVPKELVNNITGEAHNKGNIYISETSPPVVFKAYLNQFQKDFINFIRYRSEEIVPGGIIVLTIIGSTKSDSPKSIWEILGRTLNDMVKENIIEAESLDNFNMPLYFPNAEEVKRVVQEEGSFSVQKLNAFEMAWDAGFPTAQEDDNTNNEKHKRGKYVSDYMRAVAEPILVKQFGETIMDELFSRFAEKIIESMAQEKWQYVNLVISLTKN
ncbi:S-adenosyl-L-methionine:benzoic acid/salicylic acid carboxyl methyltransferase 3-like [Humulus lupulus]|uniref:S-adenosyl-L-methionine:benzoic acid/salicylic acid carboxyl methyltransferase 3-like n=1 Tax=Humulus lupulus TaxID=3486 RepID=UPI002B40FEE2|nr:S-adenosyl-L-methionine:benzoic acid/salicylic acid carboxyl methyltransferase 3-like [Humulus lupulus]